VRRRRSPDAVRHPPLGRMRHRPEGSTRQGEWDCSQRVDEVGEAEARKLDPLQEESPTSGSIILVICNKERASTYGCKELRPATAEYLFARVGWKPVTELFQTLIEALEEVVAARHVEQLQLVKPTFKRMGAGHAGEDCGCSYRTAGKAVTSYISRPHAIPTMWLRNSGRHERRMR
jgi:hypothetical protein